MLSDDEQKRREKTPDLEEEKKALEKLRREDPILLDEPFRLKLDWFHDELAGGSRFKTWAGQQSVLEIASSMKRALETPDWQSRSPEEWFAHTSQRLWTAIQFRFRSRRARLGPRCRVQLRPAGRKRPHAYRIDGPALLRIAGVRRLAAIPTSPNQGKTTGSCTARGIDRFRPRLPRPPPADCCRLPMQPVRVPAFVPDEVPEELPSRNSIYWRFR